jgi:hypothetical protein
MKPYLLIVETQRPDGALAKNLQDVFKDCTMINPFTFIFKSLEDLSTSLKRVGGLISNFNFVVSQVSESVLLRNCDNIQDILKKAEVQMFPSL